MAQAQSIDCYQNINFGSIMACAASGTVRVNPQSGTATAGGCVGAQGAIAMGGACSLSDSGPLPRSMQITLSSPTAFISNDTTDMSITNFDWNTAAGGATTTVTALATTVYLGATLNVGAAQPGGVYEGAFTVNVNYQ